MMRRLTGLIPSYQTRTENVIMGMPISIANFHDFRLRICPDVKKVYNSLHFISSILITVMSIEYKLLESRKIKITE